MNIQDRRQQEIAQMKERIMEATILVIENEGYEKLSIRKIAKLIDYSPTTIYLYYANKHDIVQEMSNQLYNRIENEVMAVLNSSKHFSVSKRIQLALHQLIKSILKQPQIARAIMHSGVDLIYAADSKEMNWPSNQGIQFLDDLIHEGILKQEINPIAKNKSWMMISSIIGLVLAILENSYEAMGNIEPIIQDYIELLMMGVQNREN